MSTENLGTAHIVSAIFPRWKVIGSRNEENYYVWSGSNAECFRVLRNDGCSRRISETCPPDDTTNIAKNRIWKERRNSLAKARYYAMRESRPRHQVAHVKHAKESWDVFAVRVQSDRLRSIMLWFRRLTKQLPSGGDVSAHVTRLPGSYPATSQTLNLRFRATLRLPSFFPPYLPTLGSTFLEPTRRRCQNDKSSTTLSSVINGIP